MVGAGLGEHPDQPVAVPAGQGQGERRARGRGEPLHQGGAVRPVMPAIRGELGVDRVRAREERVDREGRCGLGCLGRAGRGVVQHPGQSGPVVRRGEHGGGGRVGSGPAQRRPPGLAGPGGSVHHRGQLPGPAGVLEHQRLRPHGLAEREHIGVAIGHEHRCAATRTRPAGARHRDRQASELERCPAQRNRVRRLPLLGLVDSPRLTRGHLVQRGEVAPGPHMVGGGQPVHRGRPLRRGGPRRGRRVQRGCSCRPPAASRGDPGRGQSRGEQE